MKPRAGWPPVLSGLLFFGATVLLLEVLYLGLLFLGVVEPLSLSVARARSFIGPVWLVLVALALLALSSSLALSAGHLNLFPVEGRLPRRLLTYITEVAPPLGLLGTFWALMEVQHALDGELGQAELLATLAREGGQAYGSTIVAIVVAIFSFTISRLLGGER